MANYLMGDVQGCYQTYTRLLSHMGFSPSRDHVYLLGDLVNRGPQSLEVLRHAREHSSSVHCVLGNHDLHLLALAHGVRAPAAKDTLNAILNAQDRDGLLVWLAQQPLARRLVFAGPQASREVLLVHAGVLPSWTVGSALALAQEVSEVISGAQAQGFFRKMYGDQPRRWEDNLQGTARLRMIANVFTRLRFCTEDDTMDFEIKEGPAAAPPGFVPWFECTHRKTANALVAFGHWSTLGLWLRPGLAGLDTGCAWGGVLSALEIDGSGNPGRLTQVAYADGKP
jgi:bis(5'-nucleosyl)-tetraphosphatase (symmetrical)